MCKLDIHDFQLADPSVSSDARGLSTVEPMARPGDILTRAAVPIREAAIDVTSVSHEAGDAGSDCVLRAAQEKHRASAQAHHRGTGKRGYRVCPNGPEPGREAVQGSVQGDGVVLPIVGGRGSGPSCLQGRLR